MSVNELEDPSEEPSLERPKSGPNFQVAMACYCGIALLAWLTLDGKMLWVVWIFLGWFAVRTYITKLEKP